MPTKDYVSVIYNEQEKPFTSYPDQLARYLVDRYGLQSGSKILDIGCGRGEFLRGFMRCGLRGSGIDQSLVAQEICPEAEIIQADLDTGALPYADNSFNYVFSKSVLEHFYFPEKLVAEIHRILVPGGMTITLVPDWESVYKIFYEDYTHRTPFTQKSLRDILLIHHFKMVQVEKFKQLPFLWKMPWLGPLTSLISIISPTALSPRSKLIRFSKEGMLLSSAVK